MKGRNKRIDPAAPFYVALSGLKPENWRFFPRASPFAITFDPFGSVFGIRQQYPEGRR